MENWITICQTTDLVPNAGVCALVVDEQVAVFNCTRTGGLYAVSNYDPISDANVLSRGIIGSLDGQPYVASPLYKQHFHLETGVCLEEPHHQIKTYPIREHNGSVQVLAAVSQAA
ncbi:nitrite reductase small subunit NirD [Vibrio hepatarius]|jgi:nitrite reductase (NADH) small subunit|uniref:Nitrite reductase n=1 Tax=Vibrio hepatarius TaxID=171383 RepID=A0A0M0I136_9VIBR|nr:nitrite reductase small subunit NirD [Vibrio hepatarius]KOO07623.1 nitrite reductase [Vibrio hepatarius]